jgi:hypothetical protein
MDTVKKKWFKKYRFKKKENQIWKKTKTKTKPNYKGWNWKTISIKKE